MPAASPTAAVRSMPKMPPDLAIFRANTSAPPMRASSIASSGPHTASSAMIGTTKRAASRASAARCSRGVGCSIRSMPAASSMAMPVAASASFQAWFTSTVTRARSPSARLIAATWATSSRTARRPILSLKVLWRRASSSCSASAISRPVSPLARVHSAGSVSRTAPPSSVASGTPRRLPCASSNAVSRAHLAKRLPRATLFRRAMAACTLAASWPTSAGAR
ncbi:hypothetical protein D9M72_522490 [compost metagenome]